MCVFVCVTRVRVPRGVPQGVGVPVVLRESHSPHAGVRRPRGAVAQRAVAGRHGLQGQGPALQGQGPAPNAPAQLVVQREVVQAVCVQLEGRRGRQSPSACCGLHNKSPSACCGLHNKSPSACCGLHNKSPSACCGLHNKSPSAC
ncbi:hypothetical protein EYF80_064050 [Liparis tanakae]|uniref:Uncharacterized protein n=1 Tax=Liparis tanakae TaxID=230148 RepID=A0A4Z2EAH2_9TELE|nr:hypothetical protein EYF80_064050 [Liparis tanakae]